MKPQASWPRRRKLATPQTALCLVEQLRAQSDARGPFARAASKYTARATSSRVYHDHKGDVQLVEAFIHLTVFTGCPCPTRGNLTFDRLARRHL